MTPDRIRMFLYKPPPQGRAVSLLADQGLGSTLVVVTYTREECEISADPSSGAPDLVEEIQQAAIDHCDATGEPTRFMLVWFNADNRQIKSSPHTAAPSDKPSVVRGDGVSVGEPVSAARIVSELLSSLAQKDKTLQASFGIVLLAYEKALKMQQGTIDSLAGLVSKQNEEIGDRIKKVHAAPERSAEEIAAMLRTEELKQSALGKLIELGPDLVFSGVRAWMRSQGMNVPGGEQ